MALALDFAGGVGLGLYLFLNYYVSGDAFRFLQYQRDHWGKAISLAWKGIRAAGNIFANRAPTEAQMVGGQELWFALLGLGCTIWSWVKLRASYSLWMTGNWLMFAMLSFLLSAPRYTLTMFPIFILFAIQAKNFVWRNVITVWSLLFMALFIANFVRGSWAF